MNFPLKELVEAHGKLYTTTFSKYELPKETKGMGIKRPTPTLVYHNKLEKSIISDIFSIQQLWDHVEDDKDQQFSVTINYGILHEIP